MMMMMMMMVMMMVIMMMIIDDENGNQRGVEINPGRDQVWLVRPTEIG